ncbi:hypothetical protein STSP2_01608 [Anaerohalosphaera lusitana]|uniref:Uncharacterized protein n=1 Tax=Anaerohalosphaera lusitana TaxID=1936003 RepID=A0A1U9NL37_9BACT|nr:hypothetical protein [Anaerohalosphaera lusitana]AQT68444.1 hypothetical protein STSP2_01608 [Anaerohalosphaera lusitana]
MVHLNGDVISYMKLFMKQVREELGVGGTMKLSVREYEQAAKPEKVKRELVNGTQADLQRLIEEKNDFYADILRANAWPTGFADVRAMEEYKESLAAYGSGQVDGGSFGLSTDGQAAASALLNRIKDLNKYEKVEGDAVKGVKVDVAAFYKELEKMFYDQFQVKDGGEAAEMSTKTAAAIGEAKADANKLQSGLSPESALILLQDRAY